LHWALLPTKNRQQNAALLQYTQARSPFWLLTPVSEHVHAHMLPRLSWSWTVLLPSDTHRKLTTSITAVLLPFFTHLLTLPRIFHHATVLRTEFKVRTASLIYFCSSYNVCQS
jgi:hypothetical protein